MWAEVERARAEVEQAGAGPVVAGHSNITRLPCWPGVAGKLIGELLVKLVGIF